MIELKLPLYRRKIILIPDAKKYEQYTDAIHALYHEWYLPQCDREVFKMHKQVDKLYDSCKYVVKNGGAMMHLHKNMYFIILNNYDDSYLPCRNEFMHELGHAVFEILRDVGMKETKESTEAYTHLLGYATEKLYEGYFEDLERQDEEEKIKKEKEKKLKQKKNGSNSRRKNSKNKL